MRKTVDEWLWSHQRGQRMAKKKRRGGKVLGRVLPHAAESGVKSAKKRVSKKVRRKPR